ncbi:hypothetical protein BaRGS_00013376 [Batillaria attramentaria]|uniref:Uncharacterized protein n=1 Tax=Batillaria attramentaria TaxID=370345 RepID=A0ABD0L7I1_9CAEN
MRYTQEEIKKTVVSLSKDIATQAYYFNKSVFASEFLSSKLGYSVQDVGDHVTWFHVVICRRTWAARTYRTEEERPARPFVFTC